MEERPPEKERATRENAAALEKLGSYTDTLAGKTADQQARWRSRNPEKVWCHIALKSALCRGLVIKQPCQNCGSENSEAHHPDYRMPAVVELLCRPCHKREPRRLRQGGAA